MKSMSFHKGDIITMRTLRRLYACEEGRATFAQLYPQGVALTLANLQRAARLGLDVSWFAEEVINQADDWGDRPLWTQKWRVYNKTYRETYKRLVGGARFLRNSERDKLCRDRVELIRSLGWEPSESEMAHRVEQVLDITRKLMLEDGARKRLESFAAAAGLWAILPEANA